MQILALIHLFFISISIFEPVQDISYDFMQWGATRLELLDKDLAWCIVIRKAINANIDYTGYKFHKSNTLLGLMRVAAKTKQTQVCCFLIPISITWTTFFS